MDRTNERLLQMMDEMMDDDFLEIEIKDSIRSQLYLYQLLHLRTLITALKREPVVVDGSETGTGKTYTSVAVASQLGYKLMVICPKTMGYIWEEVAQKFKVPIVSITNYELLRGGKELVPFGEHQFKPQKSTRVIPQEKDGEVQSFQWKVDPKTLIIFDEVHRCKNRKTLNGLLLMGARKSLGKVLMLSATMADKPENFEIFGYLLGLYPRLDQAHNWIQGTLREDKRHRRLQMSGIHQAIYPSRGSRMIVAELGDQFPVHTVSADCYRLASKETGQYQSCIQKIGELYQSKNDQHHLGRITKIRVLMELLKVPILVSLARSYLETNCSVVIFVNFTESIKKLSQELKTRCLVYGDQEAETRAQNIKAFQQDRERVIICNMKAGSEGISLHDTHGQHRRVSLISPSYSCQELIQSLGRVVRAGAKTPTLQKLVFLAGTLEESIARHLQEKLKFSQKINNQDLAPFTVEPGTSIVCDYMSQNAPPAIFKKKKEKAPQLSKKPKKTDQKTTRRSNMSPKPRIKSAPPPSAPIQERLQQIPDPAPPTQEGLNPLDSADEAPRLKIKPRRIYERKLTPRSRRKKARIRVITYRE